MDSLFVIVVCLLHVASSVQVCHFYGAHNTCGDGYQCCNNNSECCPLYPHVWLETILYYYKVFVAIFIFIFIYLVTMKTRAGSNNLIPRLAINGSCNYHEHYV